MLDEKIILSIENYYRNNDSGPYVIGIAGGSGSGKTTLAKELCDRWSDLCVELLTQDRFFKHFTEMPHYYSDLEKDFKPSFNEPHSYEQQKMFSTCQNAASNSTDILIIEGITVLWFEELRDLMDLKIYIEVEPDERIIRRIRRNMKKLEDFDKIVNYYLESVRWQHRKFNSSTKCYADVIISGGMADKEKRNLFIDGLCNSISAGYKRKIAQ